MATCSSSSRASRSTSSSHTQHVQWKLCYTNKRLASVVINALGPPHRVGHDTLTAVVCLSVRLSVRLSLCLSVRPVPDAKSRTEGRIEAKNR